MAKEITFHSADLRNLNSFGVAVHAKRFFELQEPEVIPELLDALQGEKPLLLGGGSNILFTTDPREVVIAMRIMGIIECEDGDDVHLHVGAGENWHHFTQLCVSKGWGGVENLSLIPGLVGTAPVQNIGAYGVELKDVLTYVDAFDTQEKTTVRISNKDCHFAYRDSIFKTKHKGRYWITHVGFKLSKSATSNTSYGAIQNELKSLGKEDDPAYADVAQAVINIRQSKLPDPKVIGNAGSFFKNPVVDTNTAENILKQYPEAPNYPASEGKVKLAAGWLIEKSGWKGHNRGTHGVHERQALVLVNYGGATGQEIIQLATDIQNDVEKRFGIQLEREVNIYV